MRKDLDPVERSDAFDHQLQGAPVVQTLLQIGTRNRRLIRITLISVAFDIALSGALTLGFVRADNAAQAAHAAARAAATAASSARLNCLTTNQTHRDERKLWLYVLSFPGPPGESAAEREQRLKSTRQFKRFLNVTFRLRDCSKQALNRQSTGALSVPRVFPTPTSVPTPAPSGQASPAPGPARPSPPLSATPSTTHRSTPPSPSESASASVSASPSPTSLVTICVPKPVGVCVPPERSTVASGYFDHGGWMRVVAALVVLCAGTAWLSCIVDSGP